MFHSTTGPCPDCGGEHPNNRRCIIPIASAGLNPGVQALEELVFLGVFDRGIPHDGAAMQYWPTKAPNKRDWRTVAGLIHKASSWCGKRGLSVTSGRVYQEVVYRYESKEDK